MYKWVTSALFPHRCSLQMMLHVHGSIYSTCWIKLSFKMRLHWNLEWPPVYCTYSLVSAHLSKFHSNGTFAVKPYLSAPIPAIWAVSHWAKLKSCYPQTLPLHPTSIIYHIWLWIIDICVLPIDFLIRVQELWE